VCFLNNMTTHHALLKPDFYGLCIAQLAVLFTTVILPIWNPVLTAPKRHFRSAPNNGHRQGRPPCLKGANFGNPKAPFI
jgi:hypothetical protein